MTKSSSAAQIVSTVSEEAQSRYWELHDQDPDFSLCEFDFIAAAALRAAADQAGYCLDGSSYFVVAKDDLLGIAAELDGAQPPRENV